MGAFIIRQPNGLLCRFSEIVDTVTHYNMTDEQFIEWMAEKGRDRAREILKSKDLYSYEDMKASFRPSNMTQKEFDEICAKMENPIEEE